MDGTRFDQLARHFAAATSRRQVLKSLAAGVAATVLSTSGGSAKGNGGNSGCATFCKTVFAPGRARGQCTNDAAHGQGLCPSCEADASRVCVAPDGISIARTGAPIPSIAAIATSSARAAPAWPARA